MHVQRMHYATVLGVYMCMRSKARVDEDESTGENGNKKCGGGAVEGGGFRQSLIHLAVYYVWLSV